MPFLSFGGSFEAQSHSSGGRLDLYVKTWDNGWYVSCHPWLLHKVLVPHRLSCGKSNVQYTPVLVAWLLCRSPKAGGSSAGPAGASGLVSLLGVWGQRRLGRVWVGGCRTRAEAWAGRRVVGGVQPVPTTDGYWPVPSGHAASTQPLGGETSSSRRNLKVSKLKYFVCLFLIPFLVSK